VPFDSFELLKAPDRRARAAAQLAGILRYASSRLTPHALESFYAWLDFHGLPQNPADILNASDSSAALQAVTDLVRGLMEPVTAATLPYLSLQVDADVTVSGVLEVRGDTIANDIASAAAECSATVVRVFPDVSVVTDASAANADVASVDGDPGEINRSGAFIVGNARLLSKRFVKAVSDYGTGFWSIFEDQANGLSHWKKNTAGFANDRRAIVDAPGFDTGWLEISMHLVGDTATNPPYEQTYGLKVTLDAGVIGDRYGVVDWQVFARTPVTPDGNGPHVSPGSSQYGFPTNPGSRYYSSAHPLQSGPIAGVQPVLESDGKLRLRVGLVGARLDGSTLRAQLRMLLWLRGQS
jgi:hypothetical protein